MQEISNVGKSRQRNVTAIGHGNYVEPALDDLGRQVNWPIQVRDMLSTAFASTATLAEVTLATANVGEFFDLIQVIAANNSGAAVSLDFRAVSGGNVLSTINVEGNTTQHVRFSPPYPQDATGNAWTIQNGGTGDISNTAVDVAAIFSRNN